MLGESPPAMAKDFEPMTPSVLVPESTVFVIELVGKSHPIRTPWARRNGVPMRRKKLTPAKKAFISNKLTRFLSFDRVENLFRSILMIGNQPFGIL